MPMTQPPAPTPAPLFSTPRLDAWLLAPEDLDDMAAVYGDADAMRYVDTGEPLPRERCAHWIEVTQQNVVKRGYGMSTLRLRASGEVIGFMGLVHPGGQAEPELKYALKRSFWGLGLATEAARGMVVWGQERFGMEHIQATTDPANGPSHQVLRKAGFQEGACVREEDGSETLFFHWRASPAG